MSTSFGPGAARPRRRRVFIWLAGVALILASSLGATLTSSAATPVIAGYADHLYGDPAVPGGDDVTAPHNQSKVWFQDGRWHALMLDNATAKYQIYKFDMATQDWTNTGVQVDERNRSHGDVLVDNNTLWVASSYNSSTGTALKDLRVYKFTYNTGTKLYAVVSGFPKEIPGTGTGTTNATIAKDASGVLWVAYNQSLKVKVATSATGTTWTTADLPVLGNDVMSDDVVGIASLSGAGVNGVGVLWSNQSSTDDAFYFAAHVDGDDAATWQARETVIGGVGTYTADNHVTLRTAPDGRAIAVIKTSRNEDPAPNGNDPLIAVVRRTGAPNAVGSWSVSTVTNVTVKGTRPTLVIDGVNDQADVFLTDPTLDSDGDQAIYRRTAPLSTLSFGSASLGTAVIDSDAEVAINDANTSKQVSSAESGILVIATDVPTRRYMHACIGGPCPVKPVANFSVDTTSGDAPLAVQFTDTSTNTPITWAWDFDNNGTIDSTLQSPQYTYITGGIKTVKLTVSNGAGSDIETKVDLITVSAPPVGFFPIDPVRLLDTRTGNGLTNKFAANVARTWQVNGRGGVPSNAIAVTGNLTVVNQSRAGYISIGPTPGTLGTTSSLNFPSGDIRANGVTLPVDVAGTLSAVYKSSSGQTTHLIFDVTGYFRATSVGGATYHDVDPVRLLDTRFATGLTNPFVSGAPRTFQITGGEIPSNATAITGNLTVVNQTKGGYVSLGPVATATPTTSTINFPAGDIRANGVTVKLSGTGTLSAVYKSNSGATTHLLLDVTGYFTEDSTGARFVPLEPARVLDTRFGNGLANPFVSGTPRTWTVGGHGGVSVDAVAVVGNLTVVNQTSAGYVSVTPTATSTPTTSTINFPFGDIRANGITVKLGAADALSAVYKSSSGATTHLIFDVFGYYE